MLQTPVVAFTECQTNCSIIPKVVCFEFHSKCVVDVHLPPPPRSPFTRRLGLVLISPNWLRLLTPLLKPLLPESHSRTTHTVSQFVFRTERLLQCPPPFKQIKVFPVRLRKYRILANQTWGHLFLFFFLRFLSLTLWTSHELCWPSTSPGNSCMCWTLCHFYCQTLWDCFVVIWTILQGWTLA